MTVREGSVPGVRTPVSGSDEKRAGRLSAVLAPLMSILRAPLASFQIVVVISGLLTLIGLGMVLSSSNVLAFAGGGSPFGIFLRQALFMMIGWTGFAAALRIRMRTLRRIALPVLVVATGLLVAVLLPGVGSEVNGSRGWIDLGVFSVQPAEVAKLALIVWSAGVMASRMRTGRWTDLLWPASGGLLVVTGLILAAPDLGMATSTVIAFLCLLWFAGYPARHFYWVLGIGLAGFTLLVSTMAYRFDRVRTFVDTFRGEYSNLQGDAYQSYQGILSLADGGLLGVGLGQSSAKWFYLPEASNDFIFAIIGEELGWLGAAVVVGLYMVLGWVGLRVARRSVDPARRLLAGTLTCAIVLQAFINIGYVVGLLPVTGLQLPLISNGGTSAVVTLVSLGLLANCARHEPEAVSAVLSSPRRGRRRWYSLPDPEPYTPERLLPEAAAPGRASGSGRRYGAPVRREPRRPEIDPTRGRPARRGSTSERPADRTGETQPGTRPAYETLPVPFEPGQRRGATPMTGRTARPVRRRSEQERARTRGGPAEPVNRPSPLHRGKRR